MTWLLACLITIPPITWVGLAAGAAVVALAVRPVANLIRIKRRVAVDPTDLAAADRP